MKITWSWIKKRVTAWLERQLRDEINRRIQEELDKRNALKNKPPSLGDILRGE